MLTRCPSCATHFRVTPEQLKARAGRVRCGECQNVFNALDTLIEEPGAAPVPATREPAAHSLMTEVAVAGPQYEQAPTDLPELPRDEAEPASLPLTELAGSVPETSAVASKPDTEAAAPEPLPPDPAITATEVDELEKSPFPQPGSESSGGTEESSFAYVESPAPRRWPWLIACLFALLALGLQAVLTFRVEVSVLWPESKAKLVALCEIVGCEVGFPARIAMVGIEASDLHPDSGHKGRLALSAILKNRAPFAQQFPHLELTLTDTADKAIARKVLAPADYLPPKTAITNGMPPNADIAVIVSVDSGELAASGYRLYVFYP